MVNQFITPNWHPLFVHYPIALLILGVLIEIISFGWPRGGFRTAGRWMMLLGALLAIPAATAGIYAFRSVVKAGAMDIDARWQQVVQESKWSPAQWDSIGNHIWFNSFAVVLFVTAVIFWLAGSDKWRRSARWPLLITMLVGVGLMSVGAWYGGELVYRFGTGVGAMVSPPAAEPPTHNVEYFVSPLQLHTVLAGFVAAFVVAAFALMVRRWHLDAAAGVPVSAGRRLVAPAVSPTGEMVGQAERDELRSDRPHGQEEMAASPPRVYPGWVWLGGFLLAICTAGAGAWSVVGVFTREAFQENWQDLQDPSHRRLALHVIFGVSIIVLSLILAGLVRFARRWRVLASIVGSVVLLLVAGQVWLGTLMTYDGQVGPLIGFAAGAQAAEPREHEGTVHQPAASAPAALLAQPRQQSAPAPGQNAPVPAPTPGPAPEPGQQPAPGAAPSPAPQPVPGPQSTPPQPPAEPGTVPHEEIGA